MEQRSVLAEAKANAAIKAGTDAAIKAGTDEVAKSKLSDEELKRAKKNAASKKVQERKKAAIKTIADRVEQLNIKDAELAEALAYLTGTGRRMGGSSNFGPSILTVLFGEGGPKVGQTITGRDVYIKTEEANGMGKGMGDMAAFIKRWVQQDIYVSYSPATRAYKVEGVGAEPAGWTGPKKKVKA